jgi:hypothetical protein
MRCPCWSGPVRNEVSAAMPWISLSTIVAVFPDDA